MNQDISKAINTLAAFCGVRDLTELTAACLLEQTGMAQVDVMVLFGGSILAGGDVLAEGMRQKLAKHYIIVGGAGHTTDALRVQIRAALPHMERTVQTDALSEAALFDTYLHKKHGLRADYLECFSSNCGNNILYLLGLLQEKGIPCERILLVQDATMQRRMAATLRKEAPALQVVQYAAYQTTVECVEGQLRYAQTPPLGMWDIPRYCNLLMGEIPRLRDDANGYGPNGSGFLAHEDIPPEIEAAFAQLQAAYPKGVRVANPAFASRK